jgi:hypothetical protein
MSLLDFAATSVLESLVDFVTVKDVVEAVFFFFFFLFF